jgi:choline transport protein
METGLYKSRALLPPRGPVALVYGLVFYAFYNICLVASLGELASIWPTAGGQYHYVYILSTERLRGLESFCAAWLSTAGWLWRMNIQFILEGFYV